MRDEIEALEKKVMPDSSAIVFDVNVQNQLGEKLVNYAEKFPEDEHAEDYLFKAASLYIGMGQSEKAIETLHKYLKTYPGGKHRARIAFNLGYVYDTQLHDMVKAEKAYRDFVNKYPDDPLAADAKLLILQMESKVSDEALVDSFLKKAGTDSAAAVNNLEKGKEKF